MYKFIPFMLICGLAYAQLNPPPVLQGVSTEQNQYFQQIYNNHNLLQTVTQNPDGVRFGRYGDMVRYYDGSDWNIYTCTSSPQGKSWSNVANFPTDTFVPYTGATRDVDIGTHTASMGVVSVNATGGNYQLPSYSGASGQILLLQGSGTMIWGDASYIKSRFGEWDATSYVKNTVYTAATDLIVHAKVTAAANESLFGYTPDGTEIVFHTRPNDAAAASRISITFAVKKNDTWQVQWVGAAGTNPVISVLPLI